MILIIIVKSYIKTKKNKNDHSLHAILDFWALHHEIFKGSL